MSGPNFSRQEIQAVIDHHRKHYSLHFEPEDKVFLVGVRGYYLDSVGKAGKNDLGVWDDCIAWLSPTGHEAFRGNTDPSRVRKKGRNLAMLDLGVWRFYRGRHRGKYAAFRAFPEGVKWNCTRAGKPSTCSHINIHYGSTWATWSEGCQTIRKNEFLKDFQPEVYHQIRKHKGAVLNNFKTRNGEWSRSTTIPYILIENKRIDGNQYFVDKDGRKCI